MVLLLAPWLPGDAVLGSALAYRIVYYLLPARSRDRALRRLRARASAARRRARRAAVLAQWVAGAGAARSSRSRRSPPARAPAALGRDAGGARPRSSCSSVVLPLPGARGLALPRQPLGVGLLLLARAIQQRVDAAYALTLGAARRRGCRRARQGARLGGGARAGAPMAAALAPCRRFFYRRSSLLAQSFSPGWTAGIAAGPDRRPASSCCSPTATSSTRTSSGGSSSSTRTRRARCARSRAACLALAVFALARLLRPAPPPAALPTPSRPRRAPPTLATPRGAATRTSRCSATSSCSSTSPAPAS